MGPLLNLSRIDAASIIDTLYSIFHQDFVAQQTLLAGSIWIDPESHRLDDGKELSFWHLTTRTQEVPKQVNGRVVMTKERLPDYRRSERLTWVKLIIDNHSSGSVHCFYHRETNLKRNIRLYLWAHQHDFVVILQKLGRSKSFLVTSFYIDQPGKSKEYLRRHNHYTSGKDPDLKGCEWF